MAKGSVDMQNRTILSIVSKLKLLDLDKLELVDEAANNCMLYGILVFYRLPN